MSTMKAIQDAILYKRKLQDNELALLIANVRKMRTHIGRQSNYNPLSSVARSLRGKARECELDILDNAATIADLEEAMDGLRKGLKE